MKFRTKNCPGVGRLVVLIVFIAPVVLLILLFTCNRIVEKRAKGRTYYAITAIPCRNTGLVLGTSKILANNRPNLFYNYRVEAAARLYRFGKIKYLIVSGDNSRKEYNEPEAMKADLVANGVPSEAIYCDYAGFRTFDSVVRAREIFCQDSLTIISQEFHNERAIYIASRESVDAIGFNARDVEGNGGLKPHLREYIARIKVFWDYLVGKKPKFLGEKIKIGY